MENFHEISYKLHEDAFIETDDERIRIQQTWFKEDTVDYWRHFRIVTPLTPLLKYNKYAKCVTIGDGRFGLDSIHLKKIEPSLNILPTDIATNLLQKAKELSIISDYKRENAEKLSFSDNEFDFAFCIESYHHFPRPFIGLYEMIRISKKGVILIEPNDKFPKATPQKLIDASKNIIKKFIGRSYYHPDHWSFEESGNYVFSVSKREIEKVAIGLQLPMIAFFYYNDYYEKGVEFEKIRDDSKLFKKVKSKIKKADFKSKIGFANYGGIIAILFKEKLSAELTKSLRETGFDIVELPANPYLKDILASSPDNK